jgi:hypothetical protein
MPLLRLPYDEMSMQLAQEIVEAIPGAEIIDEGEEEGLGGMPAEMGGPGGPPPGGPGGGGPEELMAMLGGGGGPGGGPGGALGGGPGGPPPGLGGPPGEGEDLPPSAPRRRRPDPSAIRPV